MKIKFWGTRGSIPTPEPNCVKFGGDTSCVEIRSGDTLLILDAGTGIRKLGVSLMNDPTFNGKGYIFLSHSHWDHIQGFPFFRPAFVSGNEFIIHGAFKADKRLQDALRGQMGSIYFPIKMSDMPSSFHFVELLEQDIMAGNLMVRSRALNHPGGCFGYRITDGKHTVAYCTDTEPYPDNMNEKILELVRDADVFIYDAQFTPEEYASDRKGWGHSTWQEGIKIAHEANVKKYVLFHHDPYHDDRSIENIVKEARVFFPNTVAASRELEIDLGTAVVENSTTIFNELSTTSIPTSKLQPSSKDMNFQTRTVGTTIILSAPRDLSIFNSSSFHKEVIKRIDPKTTSRMILNMSGLVFIDSSGIGSLASLNDFCRKNGITMALTCVSSQILEVLKVTRINMIMDVFRTEEHALKGNGTFPSTLSS